MKPLASSLLIEARERSGLSRRELARRAQTSASALIEYEKGGRNPTVPTLQKILRAAGFDLRTRLAPVDNHDEVLSAWRSALPSDRAAEMDANRERFFREAVVVSKAERRSVSLGLVELERKGVDVAQLRLWRSWTVDERLRHLEEFLEDMALLREEARVALTSGSAP